MDKPRARSRLQPDTDPANHMTEVARAEPLSPPIALGQTHRRALVVEAEPTALRLCRDVLESSGFVVSVVDTGVAAVVAARERLPDLILMDLQLRDAPGREVIGWLRANPALRSTPIIVLNTNAEDEAELAAIRPGALLRKPLSVVTIRHAIRAVLK
jgi:DNA-binding response OmpR family regulator